MTQFQELVGKRVKKIFMNEDYLKFETDQGIVIYSVEGDCCSKSVFYDFIGVKKLLSGNEVKVIEKIDLHPSDIVVKKDDYGCEESTDKKSYQESIQVYGYRIVSIDPVLGEVSSVFSFRNYSNGYYGGYMEVETEEVVVLPEIFDDVIETAVTNKN